MEFGALEVWSLEFGFLARRPESPSNSRTGAGRDYDRADERRSRHPFRVTRTSLPTSSRYRRECSAGDRRPVPHGPHARDELAVRAVSCRRASARAPMVERSGLSVRPGSPWSASAGTKPSPIARGSPGRSGDDGVSRRKRNGNSPPAEASRRRSPRGAARFRKERFRRVRSRRHGKPAAERRMDSDSSTWARSFTSGVSTGGRSSVPIFRRAARAAEVPGAIGSAGRLPRPGAAFPRLPLLRLRIPRPARRSRMPRIESVRDRHSRPL